jgi:predicted TIM-barrel fold metal-dependent hydrolase
MPGNVRQRVIDRARFEVTDMDRRFYEERIRNALPDRIVDIHTHVWLRRHKAKGADPDRTVTWPDRVADQCSMEELLAAYRLMLPGKKVTPMIFGSSSAPADDLDGNNRYVARCARAHRLPALIFATPRWSAEQLDANLGRGGFLGVKCYLSLAPEHLPARQIRILDFLPPHHLELLNELGLMVMLHVPRPDRIRDPENIAHILEIDRRYPNVRLIIAHAGRAYCPEDVGDAFRMLAGTRVWFDIAANTSAVNFARLIRAVGPRRILFGSDLPIVRMRMRRLCERGRYVNLVPRGLYGDVAGDPNMREVDGGEAARLSFFLYEEIAAFLSAAENCGLSSGDLEDVFYANAKRLISEVRRNVRRRRIKGNQPWAL